MTSSMSSSKDSPNQSSSSKSQQMIGEKETVVVDKKKIHSVIDYRKKEIAAGRYHLIKNKIEENRKKLAGITSHLSGLSVSRGDTIQCSGDKKIDCLSKRQQDALCMFNGTDVNNGGKDSNGCEVDSSPSSAILLGASFGAKNVIPPIRLPEVKKLPPYTTWMFLDRNQRMTEDQSIVGRRRIYYDQNGGEALLCSDSEEEVVEDEEEKKEFTFAEDHILRTTIEEIGLSDPVLDLLAQCLSRKPSDIKARYETLVKPQNVTECFKKVDVEDDPKLGDAFLSKDLEAALDSFDNLFCRRCLVFDCRLHGCSQDLVFPVEKQPPRSPPDEDNAPCSSQCYRLALNSESTATVSSSMPDGSKERLVPSSDNVGGEVTSKKKSVGSSVKKKPKSIQCESSSSNARNVSESSESEIRPQQDSISIERSSSLPLKSKLVGKCGIQKRNSKRVADRVLLCMRKKQKKMSASESDSVASGCLRARDIKLRSDSRKSEDNSSSSQHKVTSSVSGKPRKELSVDTNKMHLLEANDKQSDEATKDLLVIGSDETSKKEEFVDDNVYKHVGDKSWKVIEKSLFTKGLEIFGRNSCLISRNLLSGLKTCMEVYQYMNFNENQLLCGAGDGANSLAEGHPKGSEMRTKSRFMRRKGKVRRLKYSWKSANYLSIRKRITEKKDQPCRQYNPCGCQSACGKQCACLLNGTCCEKCPKNCKFRFRGCHCAKSQCRSRQCPCFAANRECDPDVCRNCWVSCGDAILGGPSQGGDNYECRNMKLLLKQQQRVLLGRSDVSGWGAFLKVLMVAGDHRVGIFAKERIYAGEELFYDYRYEPDHAPPWARKLETLGVRKDEVGSSSGRAKKLA
ncbi:hypothetical protein IFM89_036204 [Coptis chinensis]|uniref:CXC domain-containing protein n=1 Tax=Coptis chinensis TaxID=261450 RepID=A0A835IWY7_9MAGN|nr:hypothetical protein IFM89_036204 [Coptis chinensis]